jgi:uncharacterized membrane protein YfcA
VDSTIILAATVGAFLLAGFVKGVIGLGLPTVSVGLLGLLMAPAQAAAILVVPSLVTNIWQAVVGGGLIALARRLWPMLVGICLGTFVGAVLLPHDDTGQTTIWLQALQFERDKLVQALGLSFTVSTVTLALALVYAGQIHASLAGASVVALLAALVGMLLGQLARGRVRAETFRLWFFIGLLLLGGHLALRGLL